MDLVTVVLLGIVLIFLSLGIYELFRKPRQGDVAGGQAEPENTALVADELPPTQTGIYRVRHMLASTSKQKSNGHEKQHSSVDSPQHKSPTGDGDKEAELPDPFA